MVASLFYTTFALEMKNTSLIQLIIAAVLTLAGIGLLYLGALIAPEGEIHETILIAFGEVATFAGSILGIDYHYRTKYRKQDGNNPIDTEANPE